MCRGELQDSRMSRYFTSAFLLNLAVHQGYGLGLVVFSVKLGVANPMTTGLSMARLVVPYC